MRRAGENIQTFSIYQVVRHVELSSLLAYPVEARVRCIPRERVYTSWFKANAINFVRLECRMQ